MEYREQLSHISSFSWVREVGDAVIDEIQKQPELINKIKFAFDEGDLKFTALSGSAQVLLLKTTKETLAGMILILELFPLMLSELIHAQETKIPVPLIGKLINSSSPTDILEKLPAVILGEKWDKAISAEEYLLRYGGMPALLHIAEQDKKGTWLKDYSSAYLERDLSDLARLNDQMPFRTFQQLAALRSANLLSYSELARDAGIGTETARRYLEYLRLSYQAVLLQPYHKNLTSRLVKTPKIYWLDNGLLRQLAGYGFDLMNGQIFENYVAAELVKFFRTSKSKATLSFYRTRSGMEVDFCIEINGRLIGIEVKNRKTINKSDYTSLHRLKEAAGEDWLFGIVIYRGNELKEISEEIWSIPSCRLFS
ncbi:MAG: ATP-binding protein [Bacteroidales bacterium]|nr:ATP-binding protein [Bacteroidales bacterium]